jgi:two-component system copper resistance phosphate regulon response regulator CusR
MSSPSESAKASEISVHFCDPSGAYVPQENLEDGSELSTGPRILVVDDDVHLCNFLSRALKRERCSVRVCHDGESAYDTIQRSVFNLVILDLNLPKMSGVAVLKKVRLTEPRLPILVLTAQNRTKDIVSVFGYGADDYVIKPFSLLELMARIRSLLRRSSTSIVSSSMVGDLIINREEHWVKRRERRIELTMREFALLDYLMNNVGKTVSRATLLRQVWNIESDSASNIVDVYMKYLRDKIDHGEEFKLIRTVRGVGYVLSDE